MYQIPWLFLVSLIAVIHDLLGAHVSEALRNKIARSEFIERVDLLKKWGDFHVLGEWSRVFFFAKMLVGNALCHLNRGLAVPFWVLFHLCFFWVFFGISSTVRAGDFEVFAFNKICCLAFQ